MQQTNKKRDNYPDDFYLLGGSLTVKDPELHVLCRNLAEDSLKILSISKVEIPMKDVGSVKIREDRSGYKTRSRQVPDLFLFLLLNYPKIAGSDGFKSFTNYLRENDKVKKLYTDYEISRSIPLTFLEKILFHKETFVADFDEERFNEFYQSFETYLHSETVHYRSFAILRNLEIETEELTLTDNLKIRTLSDSEFEKLVNVSLLPISQLSFVSLSPKNLILERAFTIKKNPEVVYYSPTNEQTKETKSLFDNVINALRLFKKGRVGYEAIFGEIVSDWEGSGFRTSSSPTFPHAFPGSFKLHESEQEDFIEFWHFFKGINFKALDKSFRIATNRFNSAYERKDPEDRLIDYVIALTSLFSKKRERGLERYRLSMRGAILLESHSEKRKKVRQEILEIYDKISAVVHGREIKKFHNFTNLTDLVDKAEEYVRRSIKVLLQLDLKVGGRSKIIDKIENGLFSAAIDFDSEFA